MIDTSTQLCAVIGNPVGHSLSPLIHNAGYGAAGLNFAYLAFEVTDVRGFLEGMRAMPSFRGVSVTIPHKLAVIEHLDAVEPLAAKVGSVNTITQDRGRLIGSTTDGPGTLRAFDEAEVSLAGKNVLFLGAGGAVRAVAFAAADLGGASRITILGRTLEKVDALVGDLRSKTSCDVRGGDMVQDLHEVIEGHEIIVQGTPMGMTPEFEGQSCVPADALRPDHVVFDMVYRPSRTRLIQDAEAAGCAIVYGIEMLLQQAALQFERWTGHDAPLEAMRAAVMEQLEPGRPSPGR